MVIPDSSNPEHVRENISLFDFELTREETEQINVPDRGEKHDWYQQEIPYFDRYVSASKACASVGKVLRNRRRKTLKAYSIRPMSRHTK